MAISPNNDLPWPTICVNDLLEPLKVVLVDLFQLLNRGFPFWFFEHFGPDRLIGFSCIKGSSRRSPLYQKYLGRTAGQSEVDYWVDQFVHHGTSSEDVVTGFVSSDEYFGKHTAD